MLSSLVSAAKNLFTPIDLAKINFPEIMMKVEGFHCHGVAVTVSDPKKDEPDDYHYVLYLQSSGENPAYPAMAKHLELPFSKNCKIITVQEEVIPSEKNPSSMYPFRQAPVCRHVTASGEASGKKIVHAVLKNSQDQAAVTQWKEDYTRSHNGHNPWMGGRTFAM